jgi:hypothetical protein
MTNKEIQLIIKQAVKEAREEPNNAPAKAPMVSAPKPLPLLKPMPVLTGKISDIVFSP